MSTALSDSTHLLVPIHIDALLVGKKPKYFSWANLAPDYSKLESDFFIGVDLRDLLGESRELKEGVHLHFRLPAALTHGISNPRGELEFPKVPNRWLVLRYYQQPEASNMLSKAWIIRSDATGSNDSVPWPFFPENNKPLQILRVGAYAPLPPSGFQEDGTAANVKITAVGNGDVGFSSHYPACRGILGFYDDLDLAKVPYTKLSYLVAGWYSDPAHDDPLQVFVSALQADAEEKKTKLEGWLTDRSWSVDSLDPTKLPTCLVCHGLVRGVGWQGRDRDYSDVDEFEQFSNQTQYSVDVGNSSAEALAAWLRLVAAQNADAELFEDVLTAFQTGLLAHNPTNSELDAELHRQGFVPVVTGKSFSIQSEASSLDPADVAQPHEPLPQYLQELLRDLNARQEECDRHVQLRKDYYWELYALWHRWTLRCTEFDEKESNLLKSNLDGLKSFLLNFDQLPSVVGAKNRRQDAEDNLRKKLLNPNAYDLRVMSVPGIDGLEDTGRSFVIVALVGAKLHVRIFDDSGKKVVDKPEDQLVSGEMLTTLKERLNPIPDQSKLSQKDTQEIIGNATSVAGHTRPKYRLTFSDGDRFYIPNDPVVLVSGSALERKGTYTPLESDMLPCRVTGQEVLEYKYDIKNGAHGNVVQASDKIKSFGIADKDMKALPLFAQRLFCEALLLEEIKPDSGQPKEIEQPSDQRTAIAWRDPSSHSDMSAWIIARMPSVVSVFDWKHNPWIPIYLTWEVEWQPDYQGGMDYDANCIASAGWQLGVDGEDARSDVWKYRRQADLLRTDQPPAAAAGTPQSYKGYALLARPSFRALAEKIKREPDKVPPRIKEIADKLQEFIGKRPMLSQALAGFHDGLIMRRVGDQLPPLDYNRWADGPDKNQFFIDPIREALRREDRFDCSPAPSWPFFPIRAGRMKIKLLKIVDTFGQAIKLEFNFGQTPIRIAQRLRENAIATDGVFQLRPRVARPMRLRFAPAPAGNPPTIVPASSPICGWVVPNRFDQNLTLYAANGRPLGALQKKFELKAGSEKMPFYWVDVPGTVAALVDDQALETHIADQIKNPHLRDFALYILRLEGDASAGFSGLLDQALAATEQRVPEEDPSVSVLVGRPLALVRAEIGLEIAGLPALDQSSSWKAGGQDSEIQRLLEAHGLERFPENNELKALLRTRGVERVRWPVRLGDRRAADDGLVGFFGDPGPASRPFYASWGFDGTAYENVLEYAQNLSLDCLDPLQVTLLMDPQARVHATSGFLPRVFLELPPAEAAGAKGAREVFFQTAPVLGPLAMPQIPKPSDDYGEWSWAYRPDVTNWAEHGELTSASDRGGFSDTYPTIAEGWLKLKIDPVQILGLWVQESGPPTLAWSVRGAEFLELFKQTKAPNGRVSIGKWSRSQAPLPRKYPLPLPVEPGATFVLTACDEAGYGDEKTITIQSGNRPPVT